MGRKKASPAQLRNLEKARAAKAAKRVSSSSGSSSSPSPSPEPKKTRKRTSKPRTSKKAKRVVDYAGRYQPCADGFERKDDYCRVKGTRGVAAIRRRSKDRTTCNDGMRRISVCSKGTMGGEYLARRVRRSKKAAR